MLSFFLTTCTENPSGPARARRAYLALRPEFSAGLSLANFGISIDSLRVIVVRPATDTLYDATVPFPADSSAINLQAAINLLQPVETLLVALEFRGGGVPLFTGTQSVEVQTGAPGTNPPATVAVSYTGPGNAVDSLEVTPADSVIRFLDSLRFRVAAFQAGLPVTQFYVAWTTSDTAAVKINGIGLVRAPAARRSVYVIARTPNGVRDSVPVTLIPVPTVLAIASGDAQSGPPGSPLALPLRVRVTAADGLGVKGIPVTFTPLAGGGSVTATTVVTDTGGYAETNATLGATVGGNAFQASIVGLSPVSFSAAVVAGAATQLVFTTQPAAVTAGAALATVIVTARDAQGFTATGFAGAVTMALGANPGAANLSGTTSAIATAGVATFANLHLDKAAAGYTLVASSGALTPDTSATFGVTAAAAATIALVSGNTQAGFAGSALGAPLVVKVTDAFGNAVSGTTVTWTAAAGTITPGAPTTDAAGLATASWTLGGGLGTQTAQAAAAGLTGSPIGFSAIAAPVGTTKTWIGAVSTDWAIAGNWNPAGAPAPSDNVFVQFGPANQPVLTTGVTVTNLILQSGATLGSAGFTVTATGDVDATGAITGTGTLALAGAGTVQGTVPNLSAGGAYAVGGTLTVNGSLGIAGDFTVNGQKLVASGALSAQPGRLVMSDVNDTVDVTGLATFQSDNGTSGTLSAGTLILRGGFQQVQAGTGQTATFAATGTHKTVFAGTAAQTITFANGGPSFLQDVEFANAAGVNFANTSLINGTATITTGIVTGSAVQLGGGTIPSTLIDATGGRWQVSLTSAAGQAVTLPDSLVTSLITGGTLTKGFTVVGAVNVGGDLTLNGYHMRVIGPLGVGVGNTGRLVMTNAADTVEVTGTATFRSGNGSPGFLTAGTLLLRGSFAQVTAGTGQQATFAATGTHRTVFAGTGTQTVSFANPGASFFNTLDLAGDTVAVSTALPVQGALSSPAAVTPTLLGTGQALGVAGLDVDGLVLDNVTLSSVNGTLTRFDNVTFQNTDPTATQLTISHPGGAAAFQFTNVHFLATPTTGKYISAVDNTADANVLTINMVGSQPADGSALTLVAGGALVNWAVVSFTQNPTGVAAGIAIAPAVTVTVRDALGNVNTSYTDTVTIALGANPGGATLSGAVKKTAVAGVATFDSLFLDKAAAGYTLQATARGIGSVFSTAFNVVAGAISTAQSIVTASSPTVGIGLLDTLTLQARDAFGNVITTGGAAVAFTQSGTGAGTISGTTDHNDGTYTATFTGLTIGPVTIGATINSSPVTSTVTLNVFTVSTTHSADITTNETWTAAQSPHIVTGYLRVRNGATLTIDPNAVVKFDPGTGLQVGDTVLGESGALVLDGSAGQITLTANTATPAVGFWQGLEVQRSLPAPPWKNVLIEWGGGARVNPFNEACILTVNASGAPLTFDSLHIRQCVHAAIHHFGGQLHVRASEIDSVTGSGIHADFDAVLELDTTVIRASGQEGLFAGSPLVRLLPSDGNTFLGNATAGIDIFAAQLPGLGRQTAIAGNGNDSIRVGPGRADTAVAAFTIFRQPAPYIVSGLVQVGRSGSGGATVTLDSGLVMTFDPSAGLQVGDSSGTQFGQLRSAGTASSPSLLTAHLATPWRGVGLGLSAGPDTVRHVHIVGGGGSGGVFKPGNAANLTIFQPSGSAAPFFVDSIVSDQSATAGVVVGRVGVVAPLHRIVRSTITNSAGNGLVIATTGTQPSVLDSLNTFSGIGAFPLSLTGHALAGHSAQASIDTSGPGSNEILITTGQTFITNVRPPAQIPYFIPDSTLLIQGGGGTFTLDPNLVLKFGHAAGLVIGDSAAGPAGDIVSLGTGPADAPLLTSRFGTGPGEWLGLEIGRLAATRRLANVQVAFAGDSLPGRTVRRSGIWVRNPPVAGTALSLDSVRVALSGLLGSEANSAGIVVTGAGTGVDIRRSAVDSNAGFGVAYDVGAVRLVNNTLFGNAIGIGVFSPPPGLTPADSIAGNVLTVNGYPLSTDIRALPGFQQNTFGPQVRDTILLSGGRFAATDTLPNVPGQRWRVLSLIEVDSGGALTIAADTVVFDSLAGLNVGDSTPGGLRIVGTPAVPIVLTATPTASPFPRWFGIQYDNVAPGGAGPFTEIRNAIVERAGLLVACGQIDCLPIPFGAIRYFNGSGVTLPVDSVTFRRNYSYSVDAKPKGIGGGAVTIVNSQFYNTATPLISGPLSSGLNAAIALSIHNSDLYGYKNDVILGVYQGPLASDTIDASNNWWGDVEGPSVGFSFNDSLGRASLGGYAVRGTPFATTPFFPVGTPASMVGVPDSIFPGDTVAHTLTDSVRVRVLDLEGRGLGGMPVSWTPYAGNNGSFTTGPLVTDAGGRAGAVWTLGTAAQTDVANVLSNAVSVNIYAGAFAGPTVSVNWQLIPALTQGLVSASLDTATYTSSFRASALVTNARDQFGNITQPSSGTFFDQGPCTSFQCPFPAADSVHGDTVFFRPPAIGSFVITGLYDGGLTSDQVYLVVNGVPAAVKIDRDVFTPGLQDTGSFSFNSLCRTGATTNFFCSRQFTAYVVDSGGAPFVNPAARFAWSTPAFPDTTITLDTTTFAPVHENAVVTAHNDGTTWLVVQDTSANAFGRDSLPIAVQQVPLFISVRALRPDTIVIGDTTRFAGFAVDQGGDTILSFPVHWRVDPPYTGTLTILDTATANQVLVQLDSTLFGQAVVTAYGCCGVSGPLDTLYGSGVVYNPVTFTAPAPPSPTSIVTDPSGDRAFVASPNSSQLTVIDGPTHSSVDTIQVNYNPNGLALNTKTGRLYVSETFGGPVWVIDAATNTPVDSIAINGGNLSGEGLVAVDTATNRIYVPAESFVDSPHLYILDGATSSVLDSVALPELGHGVAVNPNDGLVWVTLPNEDSIAVIDPVTRTIVQKVGVGAKPFGVAINGTTNVVYVSNENDGTLTIIDGASRTVLLSLTIGTTLQGLSVDPVRNEIYVSDLGGLNVYVVDGATNGVANYLYVGAGTADAAVDPVTRTVYASQFSNGAVTVVRYKK